MGVFLFAYYDKNWNLRSHGEVYFDLIYDEWWTEKTVITDDMGTAELRAFKGDYEVDIIYNERQERFHINLEEKKVIRAEI